MCAALGGGRELSDDFVGLTLPHTASIHPAFQPCVEVVTPVVLDHLIDEVLALDAAHVEAFGEALTYRELYLLTLAQWSDDRRRLRGAEQRLRQLSGMEPWHPDTDPATD